MSTTDIIIHNFLFPLLFAFAAESTVCQYEEHLF